MIDQGPIPISNLSRTERKEKDTSVSRILRDPENPQKFQAILEKDKQKKEHDGLTKEEQPAVASSIFDLSSQKAKQARAPAAKSAKHTEEMRNSRLLAKSDMEQRVEAKESESHEEGIDSDDEESIKGAHSSKGEEDALMDKLGKSASHKRDSSGSSGGDSHSSEAAAASMQAPIPVARNDIAPSLSPSTSAVGAVTATEAATSSSQDMQKVIDAVVEAMSILNAGDQTDVAVKLQNPPILRGAEVVLSSFGSARGQFNVAFYNLTQASQAFLQQMQAQAGIKQALEDKGYVMHMFTATVQAYEPILATDAENRSNERRFQDEGREGKKKNQHESA